VFKATKIFFVAVCVVGILVLVIVAASYGEEYRAVKQAFLVQYQIDKVFAGAVVVLVLYLIVQEIRNATRK